MRIKTILVSLICFLSMPLVAATESTKKLQALIIDGQNNHTDWPKTSLMMKQYFEESGLFKVDIYRTRPTWNTREYSSLIHLNDGKKYTKEKEPISDPTFSPNFKKYDVVISNFGWKAADWPKKTQKAFEKYVRKGGGLVVVHAANNSFPTWADYNEMTALGGWGDRSHKDGPYVYYRQNESEIVYDSSPGGAGSHGARLPFLIQNRVSDHPITQGLPKEWLHVEDELYAKLRGPAKNLTVLATAFSDPSNKGTGRHEPILMTIGYHKGRIFHTTLGHDVKAFEGVGFITTLLRGSEWAATGKVTQPIPDDFPTKTRATRRSIQNVQ